jgi:hypothetical protein
VNVPDGDAVKLEADSSADAETPAFARPRSDAPVAEPTSPEKLPAKLTCNVVGSTVALQLPTATLVLGGVSCVPLIVAESISGAASARPLSRKKMAGPYRSVARVRQLAP